MKINKEKKTVIEEVLRESKIFKPYEVDAIVKRLNDDWSDPHGAFSSRVRPKIKEILVYTEPSVRKVFEKLLDQKKKTEKTYKEEIKEAKKQVKEQSYDEFMADNYKK